MQTSSAALTTAIDATERQPKQRTRVDWDRTGLFSGTYDDLSPLVESVTVEQSLTSDLPEAAKLLTGHASASATVVLGEGFDEQSASWSFSGYNASGPLYAKTRLGSPIDIDLGFVADGTPSYLNALTGRIRKLTTDARSRTATITALDERERFSTRVTLPVVAADDLSQASASTRKPGLTSQWVIDYVARSGGFYATPPKRSLCRLSATMLGSVWPELGTLVQSYMAGGAPVTTPNNEGWLQNLSDPNLIYALSEPLYTGGTRDAFVEGWFQAGGEVAATGRMFMLTTAPGATTPVSVLVNYNAGTLQLEVQRGNGVTRTMTGPAFAGGYLGVHVSLTETTITGYFRTGGVTTAVSEANAASAGEGAIARLHLGAVTGPVPRFLKAKAVQVTAEAYSSSMWNDTFTASAVLDWSYNNLVGIPSVKAADAWSLLQELAQAEFGLLLIDEAGVLHFRNRAWRSRTASAISQRTLQTTQSLMDLSSVESIDTVRNRVVVRAEPVALSVLGPAWSAPEVYRVPASGSLTLWAEFDGAAFSIDTSVTFSPLGGQSGSGYRASQSADGTGAEVTNLTFAVTVLTDTAKVVVSNPNGYDVWLVQPTAYPNPGRPALSLWGQILKPTSAEMDAGTDTSPRLQVETSDTASITTYGEQLLDLGGNRWRQNLDGLNSLASALLSYLKDPKPVLTRVEIVADPRLQLADRVQVVDPDGLVLDGEFHLTGITTTLVGGGMTQSISARAV